MPLVLIYLQGIPNPISDTWTDACHVDDPRLIYLRSAYSREGAPRMPWPIGHPVQLKYDTGVIAF